MVERSAAAPVALVQSLLHGHDQTHGGSDAGHPLPDDDVDLWKGSPLRHEPPHVGVDGEHPDGADGEEEEDDTVSEGVVVEHGVSPEL